MLDFSLDAAADTGSGGENVEQQAESLDFDLGEAAPSAETEADLPTIDVPQHEQTTPNMGMGGEESPTIGEASASAEDVVADVTEISFDLPEVAPTMELPTLAGEPEAEAFDKTMIMDSGSDIASEEIEFKAMPEEENAADLNFDMDLGSEAPATAEASTMPATEVPELDLSGISLDMNTPASSVTEQTEAAAGELAGVNTKLDLATAYSDMGDKEGARELLEEVLKEGGPQQRERAQQMLNSLG